MSDGRLPRPAFLAGPRMIGSPRRRTARQGVASVTQASGIADGYKREPQSSHVEPRLSSGAAAEQTAPSLTLPHSAAGSSEHRAARQGSPEAVSQARSPRANARNIPYRAKSGGHLHRERMPRRGRRGQGRARRARARGRRTGARREREPPLVVWETEAATGRDLPSSGTFRTPEQVGPVTLTSIHGDIVTFTYAEGVGAFNLATETFSM
jgi:hypothetical protein